LDEAETSGHRRFFLAAHGHATAYLYFIIWGLRRKAQLRSRKRNVRQTGATACGTYSPSSVMWRDGRSRRRSRKCWPGRRRSSTPSHTHRKPDLAAGRGSIHTLQHQFKTEGQLELADHHDRRLLSAQRDQFTAADLALDGEAERRDSVSPAHRALSQAFSATAACDLRRMSVMSTSVARDRLKCRPVGEERTAKF